MPSSLLLVALCTSSDCGFEPVVYSSFLCPLSDYNDNIVLLYFSVNTNDIYKTDLALYFHLSYVYSQTVCFFRIFNSYVVRDVRYNSEFRGN
jgi:hypothetical protein